VASLRRFLADFGVAIIALPLATWGAVWFSFQFLNIGGWAGPLWAPLGWLIFFGPLLWLPIYYGGVLIWCLRPVFGGRFGRIAGAAVCLAGWASYAQYQVIQARSEGEQIAQADSQLRPAPGVDAVAFYNTICDANCTELLAGGFVKTVYLERGNALTRVLTLGNDGSCDGASALASKILRDNNRFDLCIKESTAPSFTGGGLLFQDSWNHVRDFYGWHRSVRTFTVSKWVDNRWQPFYERKYGDIYVLQYFPVFISGFTDSGWIGTDWWRRVIKVGKPVEMKDVIGEALGITLAGSFDTTVVRHEGPAVIVTPNVIHPAPPAELAADIERMSLDGDPAVLRQAAKSIDRFVKENKTYEPVRASLERLMSSSKPDVKSSAYRAIAYGPVDIDDDLVKFIMTNQPDWQSPELGAVLGRLSEDQLRPYETQFVEVFFAADRNTDRHMGPRARDMVTTALPALRLDVLKQIFDRCSEISEIELRNIGQDINGDNGRMSDARALKLQATWAPCTLQRMQTFNPYSFDPIARGMAWVDESAAAAAVLEKRLAAPLTTDSDIDRSNLQGTLGWLRQYPDFFQTQRAKARPWRR
jgi:hypothetical protein